MKTEGIVISMKDFTQKLCYIDNWTSQFTTLIQIPEQLQKKNKASVLISSEITMRVLLVLRC